jgi:UbiD family decarboxylase
MTLYTYPTTHNARNIKKFWAKGEPCPVTVWIGHHPVVGIGTQAKMRYPESHWEAASRFLGSPLRLVPSITHGEILLVPADSEMVIEGWVPVDRLEADGPFGEYTGYVGAQSLAQVVEVSCITRRKDAIYHDYASGFSDMLVPDNMLMEAKLYGMIKAVCPSLHRVYVPNSGRRLHAYIQLKEPTIGEARDAVMSAMSYRRIKLAIVFDQDVDIFDESDVMWGLATRVQWHRDIIIAGGLSGSMLDPSLPKGAQTTSKMGVDATLPPSKGPGIPRSIPPRTTVSKEALENAERIINGLDLSRWPGS